MPSEISQTEKDKCCMISLTCGGCLKGEDQGDEKKNKKQLCWLMNARLC